MLCVFEIQNGISVCANCGFSIQAKRIIYRKCGSGVAARPDSESTALDNEPCEYLGAVLRIEPCKPCQTGGTTPEIFACEIHGECTLHTISKRKPDGTRWAACATCEQRKPITSAATAPAASSETADPSSPQ